MQTSSSLLDLTPRRRFSPPSSITSSATKISSTNYERRLTVSTPPENHYRANTSKRCVISMRVSMRRFDLRLLFRVDHRGTQGQTRTHPKGELSELSTCCTIARSSTLMAGVQLLPGGNCRFDSPFHNPSGSSELQPIYGRVLAGAVADCARFDDAPKLDSGDRSCAQPCCIYTVLLR